MHYYEVAPRSIIRASAATFTYHSERLFPIGTIVKVSIGKKHAIGVIMQRTAKPSYKTKDILSSIEDQPLPLPLVHLAQWMSEYYSTHLATVWQTLIPAGIDKQRRPSNNTSSIIVKNERTNFLLNTDQQAAITRIATSPPGTILLHGITGSGKTAVYLELTQRALDRNASSIILVPEIALTSQLVHTFRQQFEHVLLIHSRQTEAERHAIWKTALTATSPLVVIGPRSALFMPLASIGLIVVDESHEPSYKQEQAPRYTAARVATILGKAHDAHIILGSATPLVSDYYLANKTQSPIVTLPKRALNSALEPTISLIDMTQRSNRSQQSFLSNTLFAHISAHVEQHKQILLFHNRRGSAITSLCEMCGWVALCVRCRIPLTLHADQHHLTCHVCGTHAIIPTSCPDCRSVDILHKGVGTKRIETELRRLFPRATIARFDADTHSSATLDKQYHQLRNGSIDIIIGTQVIAKGLDLPHLRLVGIIQADTGLSLPDYSSSERTFQLLTQAIGRVGRFNHKTEVIVQTYQPNHPAIAHGIKQDYYGFYQYVLREREQTHFPPFTHLLKLTCVYKTEVAAVRNAKNLAALLHSKSPPHITILGPTPSFYERQNDTYRWQLVIKSPKRSDLQKLLVHVPPAHWQIELDPLNLL